MPKAYIDPQKCQKCANCYAAKACPIKVIFRIDADEPAIVEPNLCHGCGDCIKKCPAYAIILRPS